MSDVQEIKDIVTQLQRLQIQQSDLLQRLEQLSEGDKKSTKPQKQVSAARELAIGDLVRIKNPRLLQPSIGTVTKITPKRITVLAANGTSIVRAHKNIILE
jgi:ribosomal protein S18